MRNNYASLELSEEGDNGNRFVAWVDEQPLKTSRIAKPPVIQALSPKSKFKEFDFQTFVKRQMATLFSGDSAHMRRSSHVQDSEKIVDLSNNYIEDQSPPVAAEDNKSTFRLPPIVRKRQSTVSKSSSTSKIKRSTINKKDESEKPDSESESNFSNSKSDNEDLKRDENNAINDEDNYDDNLTDQLNKFKSQPLDKSNTVKDQNVKKLQATLNAEERRKTAPAVQMAPKLIIADDEHIDEVFDEDLDNRDALSVSTTDATSSTTKRQKKKLAKC